MNRRAARQRAKYIAVELIEGDIEAGLDLASYTDDGSEAERALLEAELRVVAARIRRQLPEGFCFDPEAQ